MKNSLLNFVHITDYRNCMKALFRFLHFPDSHSPSSRLDSELETLLSWLWIANAAYERDKQGVSKTSTLPEDQIVKVSLISSVHKPAYYLAVDHSKRCVILCVSSLVARFKPGTVLDICKYHILPVLG